MPERGKIGIFNRSYYEEVLVVRVHPEMLKAERTPDSLMTKHLWTNGSRTSTPTSVTDAQRVVIRKFFLNVSKAEQSGGSSRAWTSRQELEILRGRLKGARLLARVHGGLRGDDPRHGHAARAVVRRARRQ